MSPRTSRRALLRAVGVATVAGVAGCGSEGATTTTSSSPTYGVELRNEITEAEFDDDPHFSEPQSTTVSLRVNDIDPNSDETYFEETVEVGPGETRTFDEAFTVDLDGPTYAMNVEMDPFADEEPRSDARNRRDGHTFTPEERPEANPILVAIRSIDVEERSGLFPVIGIYPSEQ